MVAGARIGLFTRVSAVVTVGAISVLLLGACSNPVQPTPSKTASATKSAKPAAGGTDAPAPTSTPSDPPTPVGMTCDQVLTPEQLYAFNPNFGVDPKYSPAAKSKAAHIVSEKGVACGYLNQSSNSVIEVAVAKPAASEFTSLKYSAALNSHIVPTYGTGEIEGYFAASNGVGTAQVFTGGYWIVLDSKDFAEPGDPQPLVASIMANLPQG